MATMAPWNIFDVPYQTPQKGCLQLIKSQSWLKINFWHISFRAGFGLPPSASGKHESDLERLQNQVAIWINILKLTVLGLRFKADNVGAKRSLISPNR